MDDNIERYSIIRAQMAIERSDVCVIMIDATEGFTEQDSKVAGLAHEAGKGCVIVVNKWDAVKKTIKPCKNTVKNLKWIFLFMSYAPFVFISAHTGQRIDRLFELIKLVANSNAMRITTGTLNDILAQATARVQPPTDKGKRLKIYYMTQSKYQTADLYLFCKRCGVIFIFPINVIWKTELGKPLVWKVPLFDLASSANAAINRRAQCWNCFKRLRCLC